MKKMQLFVAIAALVVTVGASAFTKISHFAAVKYSLAIQTTTLKTFGTKTAQAYKVQDNVTGLIENQSGSYGCDTQTKICTVTAPDPSNVHTDASGSWIFVDEVTSHENGQYTPAQ